MENWDRRQKQARVDSEPVSKHGIFPRPSSCRIPANTGLMRWLEINSVAPCESRAEARITFTPCQLGPGARGMNQPIRRRAASSGPMRSQHRLVNGLYLCCSKFLAHLCINPNHNNQSKGHFKLDITTVLFRKLRSITDSEYYVNTLNLPNHPIKQVLLQIVIRFPQ